MKTVTKLAIVASLGMLSACANDQPLSQYTPVIDPAHVNQAKFDKDLAACRQIAEKLQADYKKRQEKQLGANLMAGLIVGALTGAVIGGGQHNQGDFIAYGAATGAVAGAGANDYSRDLVKYGPRRVVDRCMYNRGYQILNDVGRG